MQVAAGRLGDASGVVDPDAAPPARALGEGREAVRQPSVVEEKRRGHAESGRRGANGFHQRSRWQQRPRIGSEHRLDQSLAVRVTAVEQEPERPLTRGGQTAPQPQRCGAAADPTARVPVRMEVVVRLAPESVPEEVRGRRTRGRDQTD